MQRHVNLVRGATDALMQMPDPYQDARDMRRRTAKTLAEMRGKKFNGGQGESNGK